MEYKKYFEISIEFVLFLHQNAKINQDKNLLKNINKYYNGLEM
jgi:hypothetical protein